MDMEMKLNKTMNLFSLLWFSKWLFFHYTRETRLKKNTWGWKFFCKFQIHHLYLFWKNIVFCIIHAFLLSNIQCLRDLNVIMSNEVEKTLNYIFVLKLFLQNNFKRCTVGRRCWNGLNPFSFLSRENVVVFYNVKLA